MNYNILLLLLFILPIIGGIVNFLINKKYIFIINVLFSGVILFLSIIVTFLLKEQQLFIRWLYKYNIDLLLINDKLSSYCVLFSSFFSFLIIIYSKNLKYKVKIYFSLIMLILGFTNLTLLAKNLVLILISWGILGILIYFIIRLIPKEDEYEIATKTISILGITDFCLFLGIVMLIYHTKEFSLKNFSLPLTNQTSLIFTMLVIGALGKIGSLPFHTWIPQTAEILPSSLSGYLIGAIDKIIGIYWLLRITNGIFLPSTNNILMLIGTFTIISAVFMALIQHNLKKLLSYHAISQIGYMILGISTGTKIGIIGGLLHMLNHTIYKTLLFLSCGVIEYKKNDVDLTEQYGLVKNLPLTFFCTLIASLSISGVPPLNGFFSKWLIYQSLLETTLNKKSFISALSFLISIFASSITLASFIKVINSVFLSKQQQEQKIKEADVSMLIPMFILTFLCIIFGVFCYELPLSKIILPIFNFEKILFLGEWNAKFLTFLIFISLILGLFLYIVLNIKTRKVDEYLLAEEEKLIDANVPATDFYLSIKQSYPFSVIYTFAEQKLLDFYMWFLGLVNLMSIFVEKILKLEIFDIYKIGKKIIFKIGHYLSEIHNGNLQYYLSWFFLGIIVLFLLILL